MLMSDGHRRDRPSPTYVTFGLIAANVIVFGLELAAGADVRHPTSQDMIALGGDYAPLTLHGEWWRLFSSMFLHYGVLHLAMNMLVLYQGRIVEVVYGHLRFAVLYLAAGLAGGLASLWHASNVVSVGASGAVFGVFGAFGAFLVRRRGTLDPRFVSRQVQSLALFLGLNLYIGATTPGIDLSAHLGGLAAGFLLGLVLVPRAQ
jgi:rhomboid protease GluP